MLVHPLRQKDLLAVHPGTRLLIEDFGIVGLQLQEDSEPGRVWTIQAVLAPIPGRALGGIRAKLTDNKAFVSFLNQRDLEVILGLGTPGKVCLWTGEDYPEPNSRGWFGLCADTADLEDDLHATELMLRQQLSWTLPDGLEVTRRVHLGDKDDAEELLMLLWDRNPETGIAPDPSLETISSRWTRVERKRVRWPLIS